ncbi:hypothetical protein MPL3365_170238 [Mesorhizobium plurifarium]|uniref:Uncharacterized protein n=1 Tax=Mesorhizobium plurifarium TaxID=69974 RepID=A0A090FZB8_MESPL|nr:hypothetical protein MPL3365_170238 [Mesorhizobium plurifarium]
MLGQQAALERKGPLPGGGGNGPDSKTALEGVCRIQDRHLI